MTKQKLNIAIIGSGVAGASSALYFKQQGHEVTVFEREKDPKPVGAGIMLQPTGLNLLGDFGLAEEAMELGTFIDAMYGLNEKDRQVLHLPFENNNSLKGLGIHRGALYFLLFDKMQEEGVDIKLGREIVKFEGRKQKQLIDTSGETFGSYDLIIVANGSKSLFRRQVPRVLRREEQPEYGALWIKIPCDNTIFDNRIHQFYKGSFKMMGFMPIGKPKGEDQEYVNFFWSIRMDKVDEWRKRGLEAWKKEVSELNPKFDTVIDRIESLDQVVAAPYMDAVLKPKYQDNIVFIGDAAHPMSPQLSQGSSFALLDARFLSESFQKHHHIRTAIREYYKRRNAQVSYYQTISRIVTPMFQSDRRNTWFRDRIFKWICSISFTRKIMVSTILGYRKNLFQNLEQKYYKPVFTLR